LGGTSLVGGASPRGLPGCGCFRSAGGVAATLIRQCMQVLPKIWGITPPAPQAVRSDSKCAAALIRQCAPPWGIPFWCSGGALRQRGCCSGRAIVESPHLFDEGPRRMRPASASTRIQGAGPSVCGTSRACTLETHSGSIRAHCRSSSGSRGEHIGRKPPASGETSPPRTCCCDPPSTAPEGQKKATSFHECLAFRFRRIAREHLYVLRNAMLRLQWCMDMHTGTHETCKAESPFFCP
jgi:hypothetical protein